MTHNSDFYDFLDITYVHKKDIDRKGDKILAGDNSKLRDRVKINISRAAEKNKIDSDNRITDNY